MARLGLAFFLLLLPSTLRAQEKALAADLALVPNDALAVVHVKVADIWKHDAMKDVRMILEKAGTKALKAFNERYAPLPSTVERFTMYSLLPPKSERNDLPTGVVCILTLSKPYEQAAVLKQFAAKSTLRKGKLGEYYEDDNGLMAVRFLNANMLAFGTIPGIAHMADHALPKKDGPLSPALALANGSRPVVFGINTNHYTPDDLEQFADIIPEQMLPILKAKCINVSMDFEKDGHLHAQVIYADKQLADDAEKALNAGIAFAKEKLENFRAELEEHLFDDRKPVTFSNFSEAAAMLFGLGGLKHVEDILDAKPLKRDSNTFALTLPLPKHFNTGVGASALALAAMTPSVGKIQMAANRMKSSNNLKQIGLAIHNHNDAFGKMPAAICDKAGKPLLSWRVAILPFIEQDNLYRQFKLDEPWDSEHNKKLIDKMPAIYSIPGHRQAKPNMAYYRVFMGNGALFDKYDGFQIPRDIPDGTSNTLMCAEADEGVIWTKPDDWDFDPKKPLPKFSKVFEGGFNALLADGSVRFIKATIDEKALRALITRAGGEAIPE